MLATTEIDSLLTKMLRGYFRCARSVSMYGTVLGLYLRLVKTITVLRRNIMVYDCTYSMYIMSSAPNGVHLRLLTHDK